MTFGFLGLFRAPVDCFLIDLFLKSRILQVGQRNIFMDAIRATSSIHVLDKSASNRGLIAIPAEFKG
jgi:hypothetical protein